MSKSLSERVCVRARTCVRACACVRLTSPRCWSGSTGWWWTWSSCPGASWSGPGGPSPPSHCSGGAWGYTHIREHTHTHTHTHTRTRAHAHTRMHTHAHTRMHTHASTHAHTHTHTHTHTHARARTQTHALKHGHKRTRAAAGAAMKPTACR